MYSGSITEVEGVLVGHYTDTDAMTGVTAIVLENGAVAGCDVRGGGPATRETDAMAPGRLVDRVNAVILTGGSAFGLAAADGAMKYLEEKGQGYETGYARVPIVPAAALYDLGVGKSDVRPDAHAGYLACSRASQFCAQGAVGAGTGATVGKLIPGVQCAEGGLGTASIHLPGGGVIGAVCAVNAAGDIYDPLTGKFLAGARSGDGTSLPSVTRMLQSGQANDFAGNTTISCVATDVTLTVAEAGRIALVAHDGYARSIRPAHLPVDGDTVFALSTGDKHENFVVLCAAAAEVTARAIANAIYATRPQIS